MMFVDRKKGERSSTRTKLPWPEGKPFHILSLDGGGIRGLFSISLLERFEKELAKKPVVDCFDLIAGTSTGGIIAVGLGLQIPVGDILAIYEVKGRQIFSPFWTKYPWLRLLKRLVRPVHNHDALEVALREVFGERTLGESVSRLVVPAFLGPQTQVAVLKTDHHPDYSRDGATAAWKVARATSAAPTFFGAQEAGSSYFLDGGVWANNPVMCGIVEALSCYDISPAQIRVLSIGTGSTTPHLGMGRVRAGLLGWRNIIEAAMYLTTDSAGSQAKLLLGHDAVVRVEPGGDAAAIDLDDWITACALLPAEAEEQFCSTRNDLIVFASHSSEARERFYDDSRGK